MNFKDKIMRYHAWRVGLLLFLCVLCMSGCGLYLSSVMTRIDPISGVWEGQLLPVDVYDTTATSYRVAMLRITDPKKQPKRFCKRMPREWPEATPYTLDLLLVDSNLRCLDVGPFTLGQQIAIDGTYLLPGTALEPGGRHPVSGSPEGVAPEKRDINPARMLRVTRDYILGIKVRYR